MAYSDASSPSHPLGRTVVFVDILSGRMPQEARLANYSGATAPDFHRISFCPALSDRLPTDVCKRLGRRATNRRWLRCSVVNARKLARRPRAVNLADSTAITTPLSLLCSLVQTARIRSGSEDERQLNISASPAGALRSTGGVRPTKLELPPIERPNDLSRRF